MKLRDYLDEHGTTQAHFARRAGLSAPVIEHALKGHDIKLSSAIGIHNASKGKVGFLDLLPIKKEKKANEAKTKKKTNENQK